MSNQMPHSIPTIGIIFENYRNVIQEIPRSATLPTSLSRSEVGMSDMSIFQDQIPCMSTIASLGLKHPIS